MQKNPLEEFIVPPLPEMKEKIVEVLENVREILLLQISCAKDPKIYEKRKNELKNVENQLNKIKNEKRD